MPRLATSVESRRCLKRAMDDCDQLRAELADEREAHEATKDKLRRDSAFVGRGAVEALRAARRSVSLASGAYHADERNRLYARAWRRLDLAAVLWTMRGTA